VAAEYSKRLSWLVEFLGLFPPTPLQVNTELEMGKEGTAFVGFNITVQYRYFRGAVEWNYRKSPSSGVLARITVKRQAVPVGSHNLYNVDVQGATC
jgi:hypothetical protein